MTDDKTPSVTVLGLGTMGAAIARRLLLAGLTTTVWNRSPERTGAFTDTEAVIAPDPQTAVADADIVITMMFDAAATREVAARFVPSMPAGATWMQMATIGVEAAAEFAGLAEHNGITFVDAPVLGTKGPAESGELLPLVAGTQNALDSLEPVFAAISKRTVHAGTAAPAGSALKLAMNAWIACLTLGIAQSLTIATKLGIDPRLVLDALPGTASDSPYAHIKGGAMLKEAFDPQFEAVGMLKDIRLARHSVSGMDHSLLDALEGLLADTEALGSGHEDISAVWKAFQSGADRTT